MTQKKSSLSGGSSHHALFGEASGKARAKRRKYGEAEVVARPQNSAIENAYRTKEFVESRDREEPAYQRELKELMARATKASKAAAAKARTEKAKGKGK